MFCVNVYRNKILKKELNLIVLSSEIIYILPTAKGIVVMKNLTLMFLISLFLLSNCSDNAENPLIVLDLNSYNPLFIFSKPIQSM